MENTHSSIPKQFNDVIGEVAKYFSANKDLWTLSKPGLLFELLRSDGVNNAQLDIFGKKVESVIKLRRKLIGQDGQRGQLRGRVLKLDPSCTMYDCLAEGLTDGFYDSGDVPPPEFWLGMHGGELEVFIPSSLEGRANMGIECNLSGCLSWVTPEFEVNF